MKISICIPTFEYNGFGTECLEYSFVKMKEQLFEDFNIVISDQSSDYKIRDLCNAWKRKLHIKYIHNKETGNAAQNLNNAMNHCDGEWIKILCQDDYLAYSDSLLKTSKIIDDITTTYKDKYNWFATGYIHTYDRKHFMNYHNPELNPYIAVVNTIGTPSCTTFRNMIEKIQFDTELTYAYDCEYYYSYIQKYGEPLLSTEVTIVNYLWDKSMTSKINQDLIEKESKYILEKHKLQIK
jgi:glycosyltransferase involved in cell wall biosynthesis